MLPPTLQILAVGLLAQFAAATATPTCVSSSEGYQVGQVDYLFNAFCNQLSGDGFTTQQQIYGMPVISFDFTSASSSDTCNLDNCLASYQSLVQSCQLPNSTIWGTGSLDSGCGTYNFTIWNTAENPVTLGTPTTTIQGSTLTTAPLITLTSSSTTSTTSVSLTSSLSSPTSSSASVIASSTSLAAIFYSNGTSTASGAASGSGAIVSTGSVTAVATAASTTKPAVGNTALGTSGADILRASGYSLMVVACVFGLWL
ncbi:uncharacterized protein LY89DRAFT_441818 [Mollisia scopiformis]|uniref:Uncharacterized protein n=1 Tax=Mollisia scopiformis TaxID=149040 RepID=A0A194XJN0_MOLSC|nr:uncharacterized protein LY89DRAFT_441818 [Mollisia scopiformis]KUJ20363.1 hypothetical protein LY89DRAFT_441818 [Mollisia scopiformis]